MIYIITQRDPFFIDTFLENFDDYDIAYEVCDLPNFNRGLVWAVKRTLLLYGKIGFLKMFGWYAFKKVTFRLKNMQNYNKYPSIEAARPFLDKIGEEDILLSLSAPCKIPVESLPEQLIKVNIHCGKLPEYAGMMPIFWQIMDGREKITITMHELAPEIDTGRLFREQEMTIGCTLFQTSREAKKKSAEVFYEFLNSSTDNALGEAPITERVALTKFPSKDDIRAFRKIMKPI